jgi:hypothetical protein
MSVVRSKDRRSGERRPDSPGDRRVFTRAHKIVPLWYRHEGQERRGCALDLGTEGACLVTEVGFETDEEFEVTIQLEEDSEVRVLARVLWRDSAPDQRTHMLGVGFKVKASDRNILGPWVQRYSRS